MSDVRSSPIEIVAGGVALSYNKAEAGWNFAQNPRARSTQISTGSRIVLKGSSPSISILGLCSGGDAIVTIVDGAHSRPKSPRRLKPKYSWTLNL